jgi:hypothetical protein
LLRTGNLRAASEAEGGGVIATDDMRALQLCEMALSLVEAKGAPVSSSTLKEYRCGNLTIHYSPTTGLEVWFLRKVLTAKRGTRRLKVTHYEPGEWEEKLREVAE